MRNLIINGNVVDAIISAKTISAPALKTNIVDIEGANGSLDLSTVLSDGNPIYANRDIEFDLTFKEADFFAIQTMWNNLYHGKVVTVTTDDQIGYYYTGRCTLSEWDEDKGIITCKLTVDADPFKYEQAETVVPVSASASPGTSVTLSNGRKWVSPTITPSQALQLVIETKTYSLQAGAQIVPDIILRDGDTTLHVVGPGTCEFRYRKGWL